MSFSGVLEPQCSQSKWKLLVLVSIDAEPESIQIVLKSSLFVVEEAAADAPVSVLGFWVGAGSIKQSL